MIKRGDINNETPDIDLTKAVKTAAASSQDIDDTNINNRLIDAAAAAAVSPRETRNTDEHTA